MPQVQWFFIRSEVEPHHSAMLADREILFSNTFSTQSLDSVNGKVKAVFAQITIYYESP